MLKKSREFATNTSMTSAPSSLQSAPLRTSLTTTPFDLTCTGSEFKEVVVNMG